MKKHVLFMAVLLVAVGLIAGVAASSALANAGGYTLPCGTCHGTTGAVPTATLVTNDGTTATYNVSAPGAFEWAVFNGSTRLGGTVTGSQTQTATSGSFTVPVGVTYTVYAVYGDPGDPTHGGQVNVTPQGVTNYTITASAGANGTITPSGAQTVASGGNLSFTIAASAGYHVADVLVDNASVGAVTSYQFTNVTTNHTIAASFAQDAPVSFTIATTAGANGTITPAGPQTVLPGANITFAITPSAGYYVDTLKIDGTAVQPAKSYTFTNVQKDHSVEATFAATPTLCTVTTTVVGGVGGTVSPALPVFTLVPGASITYYFTPSPGFHIETVKVNGWTVTLDDDDSYTIAAIDRNTTISVQFAANTYTLTASVSGKGTITPSGAKVVSYGDSATYTFAADAGNSLSDVVVDGKSMGVMGSYTFDDIAADHTIQAKFITNSVNYKITVTPTTNGRVTPGTMTVPTSASCTFYFTPEAGYMVDTVSVDGTAVPATAWNDDDAYMFENVTANHTLTVTFAPLPVPVETFTITATAGEHGTITPAGATTVNKGDNATYTITPDAGYHVVDVLVNGQSVGAAATYTFTNVTADQTISASFAWTKLPTSTSLKSSASTVKRNGYVTLTATLKGGTFTNTSIRLEVKKPGRSSYSLMKTLKVSSKGVATYRCKMTVKGSWFFRVKFLGNETYLPAPVKTGIKVVVK